MTFNYIDQTTLSEATRRLKGTANHLLKIWFVLKHMGLEKSGAPVEIDTANSTPSLTRLFSYGDKDGKFYVPFAHTSRFMTMKGDAARSIVQTTIQRWHSSDSVVTCNPTAYLQTSQDDSGKLLISTGREYPKGLGLGDDGFALDNNSRVSIPLASFAVWYGKQTPIPSDADAATYLIKAMQKELHLSEAELRNIFVDDNLKISLGNKALTDAEIYQACMQEIEENGDSVSVILSETPEQHNLRVRSMITINDRPAWLNQDPSSLFESCIKAGAKAILLYGPPRTGKTRIVDKLYARDAKERVTIQIHDGWGYEHLVQGLKPDQSGKFSWEYGPLGAAIKDKNKTIIVLEEINRTSVSQALGEVFSLIETAYRGEKNAISLRNGDKFFVPEDVIFVMTMNTIDQSTEEVDDALIGRLWSIEFPPRVEDLSEMLSANGVAQDVAQKVRELFVGIQPIYPLGHGYFSDFGKTSDPLLYYTTRVRPVLANHLQSYKPQELAQIDNLADSLFAS